MTCPHYKLRFDVKRKRSAGEVKTLVPGRRGASVDVVERGLPNEVYTGGGNAEARADFQRSEGSEGAGLKRGRRVGDEAEEGGVETGGRRLG